MQDTTPLGDPRNDLADDPRARHGDVDTNGDLVDELDHRLTRCITAASPGLARDQLRAVRTMLGHEVAA